MKRIVLLALMVLSAVGCYDDAALWDQIMDHESRLVKLEALCNQMNTNIQSLQAIVTALQNNDYVTNVAPIKENGKDIGYTISFSKSGSVTIYHGADGKDGSNGKDGADGKDGHTPVIGIRQDSDGVWYWTLDGDWLLNDAGAKIPTTGADGKDGVNGTDGKDGEDGKDGADGKDGEDGADGKDGVTPLLKIEEGYWYISYDNGLSWNKLDKATGTDGKDGDSFFRSVTQDEKKVYITLTDGTEFTLHKIRQENVIVELKGVIGGKVIFNVEVFKATVDLKVTVYYALNETLTIYNYDGKASITKFPGGTCSLVIEGLEDNTYYYFIEVISDGSTRYSSVDSFVVSNFYIDEYGINHGVGVEIDGVVWAPVNCGYHETDFKYGKLYQWGRKYGQGFDASDAFLPEIVDGPVALCIGQSKDNENVFYLGSELEQSGYDWCASPNGNLWNSGTESDPVKTEYDPCPEGWRVPTYSELNPLRKNYSSVTDEASGLLKGYWYSGSNPYTETVPQIFFPFLGRRNQYGYTQGQGRYGTYWSSTSKDYRNSYYAWALDTMSGTSSDVQYGRAEGLSVRCVQE